MTEAAASGAATSEIEYLRLLIDESPIAACVLDHDMRYLAVSRRWRTSFGLGTESLIGRSHYDLFPEIPDEWRAVHQRCLAGAAEQRDEDRFVRADGRVEWLRWDVRPWRTTLGAVGGIVITTEILTEQVEAIQRLRESEERFRQMSEAIEEVFWLTDPEKRTVLYVSPAYQKIWGRSCESLIEAPQSWLEAIEPQDRARVAGAAVRQHDGTYDEEYRIRRPDGSTRWIRDRAFPIRSPEGRVYRVAGVADDVTERRSLEERLRQAQKMEAVGQLAGGVAHDFNNTLTIVRGNVQLLLDDQALPPSFVESLRDIAAAADRATTLTKQLLVFSRKQPPQRNDVDFSASVRRATSLLQRTLPENVHLHLSLAPSIVISADPSMLEQIVLNLVINARDAMPRGGAVRVTTERIDADAVLTVSDEGEGIAPEHLSRIFEPFFTTKEVHQGTGLGLATVHGIIEQHGGTIDVESEVGRGATFRVRLPLSSGDVSQPAAPARARDDLRDRTILVVEDDASVRRLARRVLERVGARVLEAANGDDAFQVWRDARDQIELVLTDVMMPGSLSGFELGARLQRESPSLPVIYSSGYSEEIVHARADAAEGRNYLPKPYKPAALIDIVGRMLASAPPRTAGT